MPQAPKPLSQAPTSPPATTADTLSDVLETVRLCGAVFFLWEAPWPFAMPVPDGRAFASLVLPGAQQAVSYHAVLQGSCWAALLGEDPVELQAGDVLLVPQGRGYVMASSRQGCVQARTEVEATRAFFAQLAAGELSFVVREGGSGPRETQVLCGFLGCDLLPFNPLLGSLPGLLPLRAPDDDALQALLQLAAAESRAPRPGSRSVLLRLSELMFVALLRRCLAELPDQAAGWLAALRHPQVGRALILLHRQPAHPWTVDQLARRAGLSRSGLAEAFRALLGEPPMRYLARWRMQVAADLLRREELTVAAVASQVGYASEAAFSRAFKRIAGVPPGEWRS